VLFNNLQYLCIQAAKVGGYAVGAFNIYNLEGVQAVVAAAEAEQSPAILQVYHLIRWSRVISLSEVLVRRLNADIS
jgi:fructose/tagatose bisphosphate aldolase